MRDRFLPIGKSLSPLAPPARFADYEPDFRVVERTFTFHGAKGPEQKNWGLVELEFETPEWNPFVNVVFVVNGCKAYLDDFWLMKMR